MNDLMTKSFTSYVDLKKSALKDEEVDLEAAAGGKNNNVELGRISTSDMGVFLSEAEVVKQEISDLRELLTKIEEVNEESKTMHKCEALKGVRNRINSDIVTVLKKARAIRGRLEDMDNNNSSSNSSSNSNGVVVGVATVHQRSRVAVTGGLRKKLREVMMEFQGLRQRIMADYKETVGRRYFTVTGETPDEAAIEKIISEGREGLFLKQQISGDVVEAVAEIQDRHVAAREIEASLLQLHQVFLDMAVMVEAQGDHLDDIEHHVVNASHYVADGTKQLKGAKDYQKSSRRCIFLAIIILLILILVVVVPIATSFSAS